MPDFLVPFNYDRVRDVLNRFTTYTYYQADGAKYIRAVLQECYPCIFKHMDYKTFANGAIMFELSGANATEPLVFLAHADAPTPTITSSKYAENMNVSLSRAHLIALLEALEELLKEGYRPSSDLFLCLSMDALSGGMGAVDMATHLRVRKIKPCFVLGQGGYMSKDAFRKFLPSDASLALIGIAEKGLIEGSLIADEALMPVRNYGRVRPLHTLVLRGARFVRFPRKTRLSPASQKMLLALSKRAAFFRKQLTTYSTLSFPILCLIWRRRSVLKQFFQSELAIYAMKAEGEPLRAAKKAWFGFRQTLLPGQSVTHAKEKLKRVANHRGLQLDFSLACEASPESEAKGEAWEALETAIEIQFERAVIVPCLSPFSTDARYFTELSSKVYRFSPFWVTGTEALCTECTINDDILRKAVQFFRAMLSV